MIILGVAGVTRGYQKVVLPNQYFSMTLLDVKHSGAFFAHNTQEHQFFGYVFPFFCAALGVSGSSSTDRGANSWVSTRMGQFMFFSTPNI